MTVVTKVEPIDRDIALMLSEELSPAGRSKVLAQFAREALSEAKDQNRQVLGRVPPYHTFVDGSEGASEDRVRPDGVIVYRFDLVIDALIWIGEELRRVSPRLTGKYQQSHTLFADGTEVPIGQNIPDAREYVFTTPERYARKIEGDEKRAPQSQQAPEGVYRFVAEQGAKQFGNIARVRLAFRTIAGTRFVGGRAGNRADNRNPAITVTVR